MTGNRPSAKSVSPDHHKTRSGEVDSLVRDPCFGETFGNLLCVYSNTSSVDNKGNRVRSDHIISHHIYIYMLIIQWSCMYLCTVHTT